MFEAEQRRKQEEELKAQVLLQQVFGLRVYILLEPFQ